MTNFEAVKLAAKILVPVGVARIVSRTVAANVPTTGIIDKVIVASGNIALCVVAGFFVEEKTQETLDILAEWWNTKGNDQPKPEPEVQ